MDRAVWKYDIAVTDGTVVLEIPSPAPVVHVASQHGYPGTVQMWVEVEPGAPTRPRAFRVHGTGHSVAPGWRHVGTAICADGALVWHLYERAVV